MTSRPLTALPIRPQYLLKAGQYVLDLRKKTLMMGVLNLTPDSFSKDGRLAQSQNFSDHLRFAKQLVLQGADILDLGAESSRPGSVPVSSKEEIRRLIPTLKKIVKSLKIPVSVDTYKPEVALLALEAGASMINTIKGLDLDQELLKAVKKHQAAIVLMHMRGDPLNMQKQTSYQSLLKEIIVELKSSVEKCLGFGIKKDRIIVDPGIGFSKNADQNLEILKSLSQLHILGCPVLIGPSRKSFIGHVLGKKDPSDRLMGTAAAVSLGIAAGAHIVRVHDVEAMRDVVNICDAIINQ